jgi:hypothetical protein
MICYDNRKHAVSVRRERRDTELGGILLHQ